MEFNYDDDVKNYQARYYQNLGYSDEDILSILGQPAGDVIDSSGIMAPQLMQPMQEGGGDDDNYFLTDEERNYQIDNNMGINSFKDLKNYYSGLNMPTKLAGLTLGPLGLGLGILGTGIADKLGFTQAGRDAKAREDAAARGLAKQQEIARQTAIQAMTTNQAYGGGGGGGGGKSAPSSGTGRGATSATSSGLGGLGFSDKRLKENIELIGKSPSNINIYKFNYKNNPTTYQGVMADEVPWASIKHSNGYMMVNYDKLDVEFKKL